MASDLRFYTAATKDGRRSRQDRDICVAISQTLGAPPAARITRVFGVQHGSVPCDDLIREGDPMAASPHSVLIVDDDYYAREAIKALLARDERTRVWGTADSIGSALEILATGDGPRPDVVLLDVRFGNDELAGIAGLPEVASAVPSARILVTSVLRSEEIVLAAIEAGADGYVWKNESGNGIASAVQGVAEGRFVMTVSIAEMVLGKASDLRAYATEVLADEPRYADLTNTLKKTVYLFCLCGLSVKEIAAELQLSPNTVGSHIKSAYQVLSASSRQEAFARLVERDRNGDDHGCA